MYWVWLVILIIAVIVAIVLLNRFYRKASREVALIRTGLGGQRIITDGGFLALPFLHRVSEVNMKTTRLEVVRSGEKPIVCGWMHPSSSMFESIPVILELQLPLKLSLVKHFVQMILPRPWKAN